MKKIYLISVVLLVFLTLYSCQKEQTFEPYVRQNSTIAQLVASIVPTAFEYNTTNAVNLDVTFANTAEEPLSNVYMQIFTEDPEDENGNLKANILPVFKGLTDLEGNLKTQLSIPTHIKKLYVCPDYIGVSNKFELELTSTKNTIIINNKSNSSKLKSGSEPILVSGMITLGSWNSLGVPDYLCGQDLIKADFLQRINATLPERKSLPASNPIFFNENVTTNITLQEKGEVYITFLHEGAGWKNTFGYYTYEVGHKPQTVADIKNLTIVFPNSSYYNSGGGLFSGDKVYLGEFPKNTVVAWFVVAQGWNNTTVTNGSYKVFSDNWLNPETDATLKQHSVLVYDPTTKRYIIGFEDMNRQMKGCDNDFNDVIFYATVTPDDAVNGNGIVIINSLVDTDGDGVGDLYDEYPNDKEIAFNNPNPWSTLVYEDLWPTKGDYDFNDLVLAYQVNQISNAQNLVVKIITKYSIRAIGAGFHNGFAVQFPINPNNIEYVKGTVLAETNYFSIAANGTEQNQTTAVVPIFSDAYYAFAQRGMINVYQNDVYQQPDTFTVEIKFANPQSFSNLGALPFNPFIVKNGDRKYEIHLPNKLPTDLANKAIFGSQDDNTDLTLGKTYITKDNKPWALNLAGEFYHPYEKNIISSAYLKYDEWATSNGALFPDWYLDVQGYRDVTKIYSKP